LKKTRGFFKVIRVTSKILIIPDISFRTDQGFFEVFKVDNPDNPVKTRRANNPGFRGSKYLDNPDKPGFFTGAFYQGFFRVFKVSYTLITSIKPGFFYSFLIKVISGFSRFCEPRKPGLFARRVFEVISGLKTLVFNTRAGFAVDFRNYLITSLVIGNGLRSSNIIELRLSDFLLFSVAENYPGIKLL